MSSDARPGTLAEAVTRAIAREQELTVGLNEFLDTFYADPDPIQRSGRLTQEPPFTGSHLNDAFIGAAGEHLARRWRLGEPPAWTEDRRRFLRRPWFPSGADEEKAFLLAESPLAFRRRMIFVSAEPLRRATMPRDERWHVHEQQRTGINWRGIDGGAV